VEAEGAAVTPPQSMGDLSSLRLPIAIRRAPLMRFTCLSEFPPRTSAVWVERSRRVVPKPPRGVRVAGTHHPRNGRHTSPSGLAPLQSMTRDAAHRRARSQRSLIPKRNPAVEIHHSQAFACLGHVAPSRLPCVSALSSLDGLPGIAFNQARSRDPRPSELDLT